MMTNSEKNSTSDVQRDALATLASTENKTREANTRVNDAAISEAKPTKTKEIGGPKGLEPTRYGDWEAKGRCYDF